MIGTIIKITVIENIGYLETSFQCHPKIFFLVNFTISLYNYARCKDFSRANTFLKAII